MDFQGFTIKNNNKQGFPFSTKNFKLSKRIEQNKNVLNFCAKNKKLTDQDVNPDFDIL